jgi:phage shock protein B
MNGGHIVGLVAIIMVFSIPLCGIWAGVLKSRYRDKQTQIGSAETEQLQRLTRIAELLTERVTTLESILDGEIPEWRDEHEQSR